MALFGRPSEADDRRAAEWRDWIRDRNPFAIASLVLGVFSLIEFGALIVFGVAGIALGVVALVQLRRAPRGTPPPPAVADQNRPAAASVYDADDTPWPKTRGHRMAWAGIALSALSLVVAAVLYIEPWKD